MHPPTGQFGLQIYRRTIPWVLFHFLKKDPILEVRI
jgi:hypothetical protein